MIVIVLIASTTNTVIWNLPWKLPFLLLVFKKSIHPPKESLQSPSSRRKGTGPRSLSWCTKSPTKVRLSSHILCIHIESRHGAAPRCQFPLPLRNQNIVSALVQRSVRDCDVCLFHSSLTHLPFAMKQRISNNTFPQRTRLTVAGNYDTWLQLYQGIKKSICHTAKRTIHNRYNHCYRVKAVAAEWSKRAVGQTVSAGWRAAVGLITVAWLNRQRDRGRARRQDRMGQWSEVQQRIAAQMKGRGRWWSELRWHYGAKN